MNPLLSRKIIAKLNLFVLFIRIEFFRFSPIHHDIHSEEERLARIAREKRAAKRRPVNVHYHDVHLQIDMN